MPLVRVTMPTTGQYTLEVEVDDPDDEDAVEIAFFEKYDKEGFDGIDMEWEFTQKVNEGWVSHAMLDEMKIEVLDDEG